MVRVFAVSLLLGLYVAGAGDPSFEDSGSELGLLSGSHTRNGARQPKPTPPAPLDEVRATLATVLGPDERVELIATAVGCALVLTSLRLLLVRQGASFRKTTGVRSWPLDRELVLRIGQTQRQAGRLVIEREGDSASVFLRADQTRDVEELITRVHRRTFAPGAG